MSAPGGSPGRPPTPPRLLETPIRPVVVRAQQVLQPAAPPPPIQRIGVRRLPPPTTMMIHGSQSRRRRLFNHESDEGQQQERVEAQALTQGPVPERAPIQLRRSRKNKRKGCRRVHTRKARALPHRR